MEALGGTVTVAGLVGQPEVNPVADATVASGGAMMAAGGAGNLLATAMQITGGVAQAVGGGGSVGWSNIGNGVASLTAGAVMGWFGGSSMMSGNSVSARAINSAMGRAAAFGGLAADATSAISPGMSPAQAGCGQ